MQKMVKKIGALALSALCFVLCLAGCKAEKGAKIIYMPDGAPALAFAGLMAEDTQEDGVEYRVVAPTLIGSKVTNKEESKNADLCVLPVTAASKLLGDGSRYVMLGGVTHGNLYLIGKTEEVELSSLVGKTVGVLQINEVPGLTFKAVLNRRGLPWQELKNEGSVSAEKVNLVAISGADAVGVTPADCYLVAEPAATAQAKKGYRIVGDLQKLYGGEKGYPQAVLVAKRELVEKEQAWVRSFTDELKASTAWVGSASGEALVATVSAHLDDPTRETSLKAPLLTGEVVARCGIFFAYAAEMRTETESFLSALIAVNERAAAIPQSAFYW